MKRVRNLHEEDQLGGLFVPQQLAEGVDEEVEGQQADLDQEHQRVVARLQRLRPEGRAPGRAVAVPRRIQGCSALALQRNIKSTRDTVLAGFGGGGGVPGKALRGGGPLGAMEKLSRFN